MHNWGGISFKRYVMKAEGALWFWEVIAHAIIWSNMGWAARANDREREQLFHACRSTVFAALGNNCRSESIPGECVLIALQVL